MEQTAKREENHHTIVRIPLPKSSLTRINGIHIDLTNSIDEQQDKRKCEHFTIRGYVTEERKKDVSVCVPLFINKKQNEAEDRNSTILPPMEVAKFKDWRCHNCLRELGSACSLKEIGKLSESLPSKKANLNNAPPILESALAGGSENDVNHQILPAAKDIITIQPPLVLEKYADDSDVIGKKIRGNLDSCDPSFKDHLSTKFENAIARIGKATVQHRRESDVTGNLNSEPRNNDQSKGDDGIPMEIDELVAKHQYKRRREEYERRRAEYEKNLCLQGRNNGKTKLESMGGTRILGNGLLKSYPVEHQNMRKQIFHTKDVKLSDQLAPISINEPQANMIKLGGKKSAFVKWNSLTSNQGTREARYSSFANNANFPQASKFAHNSQVSEGSSYWKMAKGLDLNFANQSCRNFEKQNRVFDVESLGKSSDLKFGNENYRNFAKKSTDSSVRSHGNPSDLDTVIEKYSYFKKNKDVGVDSLRKSSGLNFVDKPFSSSGYPLKVLDKPLFITDHSTKLLFGRDIGVSTSTSRLSSFQVPDKPMLISNDHSKEPFGRDIGVSTSGSRLSSFQVLDKPIYISDGHSEEQSGRGFGLFSSKASSSKVLDKSMLMADDRSKEPFGRDIGVSTNGSRLSSFQVLDKPIYISDGHSEKPSGRGFGLFSSKASSSKVLDKPMLIADDRSKKPFGRDIGVSTNGSRLSSFQVLDKPIYISDGHSEEPSGRGFGLFSSKASSSKVLDKPILISDDHSKEPFGRDIGVSTNGSRLSSFQVLDKPIYISDGHSEKPSGRGFELFSSKASSSKVLNKPIFISDDHSKEPFGRDIGVSTNGYRLSSFQVLDKPIYISDGHSEKPSGRGFGLFSSKASSSRVLDKPILISGDHSKEPFGRDIGVSTNGSRLSSFQVLDKPIYISDGHSEEPSGKGFGLFSSKASSSNVLDKPMLISDDHSKEPFGRYIGVFNNILRPFSFSSKSNPEEGNGLPTQVSSKSEEKNKGQAKNSAGKLQNFVSVPNGQNTSRNEFCDVNRNPADFSFAEPENEFTISGSDLKLNQTMSLKRKQGTNNKDGKKKQKTAVPTVPKPQ